MQKFVYELTIDSWEEGTVGIFSSPVLARAAAWKMFEPYRGKSSSATWGSSGKDFIIKRIPLNVMWGIGSTSAIYGIYDPESDEIKWSRKFNTIVEP